MFNQFNLSILIGKLGPRISNLEEIVKYLQTKQLTNLDKLNILAATEYIDEKVDLNFDLKEVFKNVEDKHFAQALFDVTELDSIVNLKKKILY